MLLIREFTEKERERIKYLLIEKGRECFSKYGIKKTSIEELTKGVGIAKGSFYSFFTSKEELYFSILMNEIESSINYLSALPSKDLPPKELIRKILRESVSSMDTNPILNKMLIPEEYELVYRKIADDTQNALNIINPLVSVFSELKKEGKVLDRDPLFLANIIKCIFLLTTHKKEIGLDTYKDVIDFYIDMVSEKFSASQ